MRIAVAYATVGRPEVLRRTVSSLALQSRQPDAVIVCGASDADVEGLAASTPHAEILISERGLSKQRNRILKAAQDYDVLVFLDDDFVCHREFLRRLEWTFSTYPYVVCATGNVILDGILGPGLTFEEASLALEGHQPVESTRVVDIYNAYGCNMAIRMSTQRQRRLRFDERLPLYAWLEDVDFSRQLAPFGRIVRVDAAVGVHLGVKSGRLPGTRLGYSQIANPLYLLRKGTYSPTKCFAQIGRNLAANLAHSLVPEPFVDRRGRLKGNCKALKDLFSGTLRPEEVLKL